MTPLARKLIDFGMAMSLNDRDLIEAVKWMTVRGYGFTVKTIYNGVNEIDGYDIKRD